MSDSPSGSGSGVQPAADPMIGQVLDGRYRITARLGEGGMGEVYAAEHVHIVKRLAIKLLRNEILTNEEAVRRFSQEARSASSIGHKNIIGIEDFGKLPDGRIYLAMELLEGRPLSELIQVPQPPERLLNILIQTGHGLAAAHKKGIVHRDMKPENIFVTFTPEGEDVPKLLDFGIAKVSGADGNNHLTRTGTIFGTPFYMAPEQALGQNVDHRADVYAMGVIMYEVFCGSVPFQGESFMGILTQHITAEPKPPSQMAAEHGKVIPPGVEEIILRAMRKDPDQRYQSMDELVQALVGAYRTIAGAGMSTYMQAHQPSGVLPAAGSAVMPAGRATPTPVPYQGGGVPSGPMHVSGSAPYAVPHSSGVYGSASESLVVPKKSRAGIVIAIVLLLALGGGAAAAFVVLGKRGKAAGAGGAADGSGRVASVVIDAAAHAGGQDGQGGAPAGGEDGVVDPSGAGQGGKGQGGKGQGGNGQRGEDPSAGEQGGEEHSGGDPVAELADAGAAGAADAAPAAEKVVVLVNSRPQGAEIYGPGGERLGVTPANVWVEKGNPITLTLKRKRYKDATLVVDGTQKKVSQTLDRIARPSGSGGGQGGGHGGGGGSTDKPPPNDPCAKDPGSIACRCKKDPTLPECALE